MTTRRPHTEGPPQQPVTYRTQAQPRYSQVRDIDGEEDGFFTARPPRSALRHRPFTEEEQERAEA
jgi:hypothetical protein